MHTSPADVVDAQCRDLARQIASLREGAQCLRAYADQLDQAADGKREEMGDWNREREAALLGSVDVEPIPYVLTEKAAV